MTRFKRLSFLISISLGLLAGLFLVAPAEAQDILRVGDASGFGLPGAEIAGLDGVRAIIVRVIQIILGFLGLVAVAVIIYGGYTWMTAGGNADRVQRARTILINATIGLVLVIASYAIVSFIVNQFTEIIDPAESCAIGDVRACGSCGGIQECVDPDLDGIGEWEACSTGTLCPEGASFSIIGQSPNGNNNPVNSEVKIRFNKNVQDLAPVDVQNNFIVKATDQNNVETDVPGVVAYEEDKDGNDIKYRLVFTPNDDCDLDASQKCFPKNVIVNVQVNDGLAGLLSEDGDTLSCPIDGCTWSFGVGEGFDANPPTVSLTKPRRTVPRLPDPDDSRPGATMSLIGRDDFKIAGGGFRVSDGAVLGHIPSQPLESPDFVPSESKPKELSASALWDTSSLALGSLQTVTAWVDDVAGRGPVEYIETVEVVAAHCDNGIQDADETDIDCGGVGCQACSAPIITHIEPADAAPGDYVQIRGRYFGDDPGANGRVTFAGPNQVFEVPAIDDEVGLTPAECIGVDTWQDNQIIIQLPSFTVDEDGDGSADSDYIFNTHVAVTNAEEDTGDTLHWSPAPLTVNTAVKRPSLCGVVPNQIRQCDAGNDRLVELAGRQFGGDAVNPGNVLFGDKLGNVQSWSSSPSIASAFVPSLAAGGPFGTRIENTEQKYCVGGLNAWQACSVETECATGICEYAKSNPVNFAVESCVSRPVITEIKPDNGTFNQIITIKGRHFGNSPREVLFINSDNNEVSAQFEFPAQCGATDYWSDNQIIAKVPNEGTPPSGLTLGGYDVVVRLTTGDDANESDPYPFTVADIPLQPGLVCAIPDNGPEGILVDLVGEALGDTSQEGVVVFHVNTFGDVNSWSENVIQTEVPVGAISGPLFVVKEDGLNSNPLAFTVGSCSVGGCDGGEVCCGDGSCRASVDECTVPPTPPLSSYRWRVTTGNPAPRVIEQAQCLANLIPNWSFENYDDDNTRFDAWGVVNVNGIPFADDEIDGNLVLLAQQPGLFGQVINVPLSAEETLVLQFWVKGATGDSIDVFVTDEVGNNIIGSSISVSETDVWERISLTGSSVADTSQLILAINAGSGTMYFDAFTLQSSSIETSTTQSPSPYGGTVNACTNAALSLRFTTELSDLGSLTLAKCENNERSCSTTIDEATLVPSELGLDGLIATPTLEPEQWYKATIDGVVSDEGVVMLEPYSWVFRTGDGACAIGGASCSPARHTLTSSSGNGSEIELHASLQALNCNILTCTAGDINWTQSPDSDGVTTLGASGVCSVPVSVKVPNPVEGTDIISPEVADNANAVVGMCEIKVRFSPLEVEGVFPNCGNACLNAKPVIALSTPVATVTYPEWGERGVLDSATPHYKIEECDDRECTTSIDVSDFTLFVEQEFDPGDLTGLSLPVNAGQYFALESNWPFQSNKFYRITLFGGEGGIRSVDDKELQGGDYTWTFGTGDSQCVVDRVSLSPKRAVVDVIGAEVDYSVSPFSSPDACAPRGQLLTADSYDYTWKIEPHPNNQTDPRVADLTQLDINPDDGRIDPIQSVTAIGTAPSCVAEDSICEAVIEAEEKISTQSTNAEFVLECGFTPAGECRALSNNLAENGNFEAAIITPDELPGWIVMSGNNYTEPGVTRQLVDVGGVVGGTYFREVDTEDCPSNCLISLQYQFDQQLATTKSHTISFYARSNNEPEASIFITATPVDFLHHIFSEPLTTDWQYYQFTYQVPAGTEGLVITFPATYDLDGVSINEHACTNNPEQSCSTNNECNIDSEGGSLNICGNGGPDGTCLASGVCSNNDLISCTPGDNSACRLAVNPNGCCGVRPYVTDVKYATYRDGVNEFICLNSGFEVEFNSLMNNLSFNDNVRLEWKDTVLDADGVSYEDCNLELQLAAAERGFFARIFAFIKNLFGFSANAAGNAWCGVEISTATRTVYDDVTGRPQFTKLLVYPDQLLNGTLEYRIVVEGETVDNPTGGVRSIHNVAMQESRPAFNEGGHFQQLLSYVDETETEQTQDTPAGIGLPLVGDRVCEIDYIAVDIAPELPQDTTILSTPLHPRDLFQCIGDECFCSTDPSDPSEPGVSPGEPGCRITSTGPVNEDAVITPSSPGSQHTYSAEARTDTGGTLSSNFTWSAEFPDYLPVSLSSSNYHKTNVTLSPAADVRYGLAKVNVSASILGTGVSSATNSVNVIFDRCNKPWVGLKDIGTTSSHNNFQTTYCLDRPGETDLPRFTDPTKFGAPTPNPLGIRAEWIIRDAGNKDAIAFRIVENKLHLTPLQWYTEQPFEKGSPKIIDGGIDGYPAIQDGRTAYISFGNVVDGDAGVAGEELYTNILIVSHSQNASEETVQVYNRLLDNLTFNVNKLGVGQCRSTQNLLCTSGSADKIGASCVLDSECGFDGNNQPGVCGVALEGRGCLIDNDCSVGYVCSSTKAKIIRDVDRFTKLLDIQGELIDYRYGNSCPQVTVGAPGDADCNGVINGQDIIRAGQLVGSEPPSYCQGADFNLSGGNITQTDVGEIQQLVQRNCSRSGNIFTNYPALNEGTFVENMTTSVWPSWNATLAEELRVSLPTDPINLFSQCGVKDLGSSASHSPYTCWDPASKTYASYNAQHDGASVTGNAGKKPDVPAGITGLGTHVFTYAAYDNGRDYALCAYLEADVVPNPPAVGQTTNATEGNNRVCLLSASVTANLPISPPDGSLVDGTLEPSSTGSIINLRMNGGGSGSVTLVNGDESLVCNKGSLRGSNCTLSVPFGTTVQLDPDDNLADYVWGNICSGNLVSATSTCEITASNAFYNLSVVVSDTATVSVENESNSFTPQSPPQYLVKVNGVTTSCVPTAEATDCGFSVGDSIEISPTFGSDVRFVSWGTDSPCAGQGAVCSFTLIEDVDITFNFQERKKVLLTEIIAVNGEFGGTVVENIENINDAVVKLDGCDDGLGTAGNPSQACREIDLFSEGDIITLLATPRPNSGLRVQWEGCDPDGPNDDNLCQVTMSRDKTVRARFVSGQPRLTLNKDGDTSASVISVSNTTPAISCPSGCGQVVQDYQNGTTITLKATPSSNGEFVRWSGSVPSSCEDSGNGPPELCTVTIIENTVVTAEFKVPKAYIRLVRSPQAGGTTSVQPAIGKNSCGPADSNSTCIIEVPADTFLTLTTSMNIGYTLTNLSDGVAPLDCLDDNYITCQIASGYSEGDINNPDDVNINFEEANVQLTVNKTTSTGGNGTITSVNVDGNPDGNINCDTSCTEDTHEYGVGETVILKPTAEEDSEFNGWTNCPKELSQNRCELTMGAEKQVSADFRKKTYRITINVHSSSGQNAPTGSVVNLFLGDDINPRSFGPGTGTLDVTHGTEVRFEPVELTADTAHVGWGDICDTANNATEAGTTCGPITVTSPINATGLFTSQQDLSVQKFGTGEGNVKVRVGGVVVHTFNFGGNEDVQSYSISEGSDVILEAEYPGGGWITTFQCPGGSNIDPSGGSLFCPSYQMGNSGATANIRFNTAPVFDDLSLTPLEDELINFTIRATDGDLDVDTYKSVVVTPPSHGTLTCTNDDPARIAPTPPQDPLFAITDCTYTPSNNFNGSDSFTYKFSDGYYDNETLKTVDIFVIPLNDPPEITFAKCSTPASIADGQGFIDDCNNSSGYPITDGETLELYCLASDPDNDSLTYSWSQVGSDTLEIPISNTDLPSITIPVRADVLAERTGSLQFSFASESSPAPIPYEHQGNAIVLFYGSSNTNAIPDDHNIPTITLENIGTGEEMEFERLAYEITGGSGALMATYYLGPDSSGGVPLSDSYEISVAMDTISNATSGFIAVSYEHVAALGVYGMAQGDNRDPIQLSLAGHSITSAQSTVVGGFISPNTNGVFKFNSPSATNIGMINGNQSTLVGVTNEINYSDVNCNGADDYCTNQNDATLLPGSYRTVPAAESNFRSFHGFYGGAFEVISQDPNLSMEPVRAGGHNNYSVKLSMVELLRPSLSTQNLAFQCVVNDGQAAPVTSSGEVNVDRLVQP